SALKVEMDLGELFDEINSYCGEETMIAAAYLHARFEYIFPFADGNGRVGRALLNYYLITHGHPPLVIFISERELYLDCLARYDEDEELDPLVELLKYETVRTWEGRV
ncbi:MAG: Fic family protein, partial [Oscillospiraceae bacterium]